jgi:hypothetical protein
MASRFLFAALLTATVAFSGLAHADPSAEDKETARNLMTEGRADRDKGDLSAALKAFDGADALMHVTTTGLEVARTQVALGLLVEALETATRVSKIGERPGDPAPFKTARDAAKALHDDLQVRIPSLTVTVTNIPDGATAAVTIDNAPLPNEAIGKPRRLNPGHHVVSARAGGADGKGELDLAEKDHKQVTIELPAPTKVAATTGVVAPDGAGPTTGAATTAGDSTNAGETTPEPDAQGTTGKSAGSKVLMFGGFGLAGAGVIVGSITGVLSLSKTNTIKGSTGCQQHTECGPTEYGDISSAKSMATVSTVSFIVAGAGAVLGVVGLLTGNSSSSSSTSPEKPATDESSSRIEPWLSLGAAGLRGSF